MLARDMTSQETAACAAQLLWNTPPQDARPMESCLPRRHHSSGRTTALIRYTAVIRVSNLKLSVNRAKIEVGSRETATRMPPWLEFRLPSTAHSAG